MKKTKTTPWTLDDHIRNKQDAVNYIWAALDDIACNNADEAFLFIACQDIAEIAERRGWVKRHKLTPEPVPIKKSWKCRLFGHRWAEEPTADIRHNNKLWHQYCCKRCGLYKGKWLPL